MTRVRSRRRSDADRHPASRDSGGEGVRTLTAAAIAAAVGGEAARRRVDVDVRARRAARPRGPRRPELPGERAYAPLLAERDTPASCSSTPELAEHGDGAARASSSNSRTRRCCRCCRRCIRPRRAAPGMHPTARIGRGVTLGDDVSHRAVRRARRRRDDRRRGRGSTRTSSSAPASRSAPTVTSVPGVDALRGHDDRRPRASSTPARASAATASATCSANGAHAQDPARRPLHHRGRRRDRREHDDRPRQHRRHRDRRRHQDRQPRADRAQRAHRPALPDHGAGRHRGLGAHRDGVHPRRPGGRRRAHHDRRRRADRRRRRASSATCRRARPGRAIRRVRTRKSLRAQAALFKLAEHDQAARAPARRERDDERLMRRTIARDRCRSRASGCTSACRAGSTFRPAPSGDGHRVRPDATCPAHAAIPALVEHAVLTERRTQLGEGDDAVHTVEHVLAAVAGARDRRPDDRDRRARAADHGRQRGSRSSMRCAAAGVDRAARAACSI